MAQDSEPVVVYRQLVAQDSGPRVVYRQLVAQHSGPRVVYRQLVAQDSGPRVVYRQLVALDFEPRVVYRQLVAQDSEPRVVYRQLVAQHSEPRVVYRQLVAQDFEPRVVWQATTNYCSCTGCEKLAQTPCAVFACSIRALKVFSAPGPITRRPWQCGGIRPGYTGGSPALDASRAGHFYRSCVPQLGPRKEAVRRTLFHKGFQPCVAQGSFVKQGCSFVEHKAESPCGKRFDGQPPRAGQVVENNPGKSGRRRRREAQQPRVQAGRMPTHWQGRRVREAAAENTSRQPCKRTRLKILVEEGSTNSLLARAKLWETAPAKMAGAGGVKRKSAPGASGSNAPTLAGMVREGHEPKTLLRSACENASRRLRLLVDWEPCHRPSCTFAHSYATPPGPAAAAAAPALPMPPLRPQTQSPATAGGGGSRPPAIVCFSWDDAGEAGGGVSAGSGRSNQLNSGTFAESPGGIRFHEQPRAGPRLPKIAARSPFLMKY